MRRFRPTLVAGALALALSAGTASAQFTNTYIFGDSLSDAGQYGSRFTTNPGLVTPMYVGQNFGITVDAVVPGGLDYAQGGARVNSPSPAVPAGVPDFSIVQQVNQQLAKTPVLDPSALYQIQGGANDIFTLATQFLGGQITQAQLQGGVTQAALDLAAQVVRLRAAGAQYIIVQRCPTWARRPTPSRPGAQAQQLFTALSQTVFNTTLNAAIATSGVQVDPVQHVGAAERNHRQSGLYGFVNATQRGVHDAELAATARRRRWSRPTRT